MRPRAWRRSWRPWARGQLPDGAHPKKTFGKDLQAGVSMDQYAASVIGNQTRFASLELGCEEGIQGGNCDNGYSCVQQQHLVAHPSTPNPPEIRPRAVFERLFGAGEIERDPVKRARKRATRRACSIPSAGREASRTGGEHVRSTQAG